MSRRGTRARPFPGQAAPRQRSANGRIKCMELLQEAGLEAVCSPVNATRILAKHAASALAFASPALAFASPALAFASLALASASTATKVPQPPTSTNTQWASLRKSALGRHSSGPFLPFEPPPIRLDASIALATKTAYVLSRSGLWPCNCSCVAHAANSTLLSLPAGRSEPLQQCVGTEKQVA